MEGEIQAVHLRLKAEVVRKRRIKKKNSIPLGPV
jgi:hypothetical protein